MPSVQSHAARQSLAHCQREAAACGLGRPSRL